MLIQEAKKNKINYEAKTVDIIVVGAGHAGCEAAVSAAHLGKETILFCMNLDSVGNMPCNPSIGGTAKGQLVREIDALGGIMGEIADRTSIQYRMLNASKGPAVLSPRAQIDRRLYQDEMKSYLEQVNNLHLIQAEIMQVLVDETNQVIGVLTKLGAIYRAKKVIIATGTYLNARVFVGEHNYSSGPDNLNPSIGFSQSLQELGLKMDRFKTGTPSRVNYRSIDTTQMEEQPADELQWTFSYLNEMNPDFKALPSQSCWLTWTTDDTRVVIEENLHRSPLFSGEIEGVGPRYCPSIEDKFVRFPDKGRHQIFVEPMGQKTQEMYLQGLSSSLPEDVQVKIVQSLKGLKDASIQRPAYAIEYDCLDPMQMKHSLEIKSIPGLYTAGQINGTSGYEEAAAQGLMAGINAARAIDDLDPLVLGRDQAYIGVLIDDLIMKGTKEPYRMMTSRAEYRLILRQDNADTRLTPVGFEVGLVSKDRYDLWKTKREQIETEIKRLQTVRVKGDTVNSFLSHLDMPPVSGGISLAELLMRPTITYDSLAAIDSDRPSLHPLVTKVVEVEVKYAGYIEIEERRIEKFQKLEKLLLPDFLDYTQIHALRLEARQKLQDVRPSSIGQASRISGVSPADISVLLVYLESLKREG